ncbi:MAG: helix-turn-helix domain-containing protein [Actinomycetota bacterium]|nr:helix-turn-helix domain-containing protein [Actinomycetota bacterium]MDQ2957148.1 helix-turn-helix domain-containing protein [Actinomycetota bacterium]
MPADLDHRLEQLAQRRRGEAGAVPGPRVVDQRLQEETSLVIGQRRGGRPQALSADQVTLLRQLHRQGEYTVAQIAATLNISLATVYRYLEHGDPGSEPQARSAQ